MANNEIGGRINFKDGIISENVDMTNAIIRGKIISNVIELTQANFNDYMMVAPWDSNIKIMDFNKLLGVKTTVIVKYQSGQNGVYVPGIYWWSDSQVIKSPMNALCNADDFIGNRIRVINESNYPFGIGSLMSSVETGTPTSHSIPQNTEMCVECVMESNSSGRKNIFWKIKYQGDIVDYN